MSTNSEQLFESKLLSAIIHSLKVLGELENEDDFLATYPKENLADVHNNETGAYYLMTGDKPLKLVEYNLITQEVLVIVE
jgi:hypothetical protein